MISLSFAIEAVDDNQAIQPIVDEINSCLHSGIPVFAAASNDGGSSKRAFPAEQKDVLCIHAGSHDKISDPMNPVDEVGKDNFLFLGCDVLSSWSGCNADGSVRKRGKAYRTGTSYAVPVAVSIAAFMVAYIHCKAPDSVNWNIKPQSPQGLREIFEALVVRGKYQKYDWVSPYERLRDNRDILSEIKKRLSYG